MKIFFAWSLLWLTEFVTAARVMHVYSGVQNLVGVPVPLHRIVAVAPCACGDEDVGEGVDAWLYDFLPQAPQDPATALRLVTGGSAEGVVRCRKKTLQRAGGGCLSGGSGLWLRDLGPARCTADDLEEWARGWDPQLSLLRNDCWSFASSVERRALQGP